MNKEEIKKQLVVLANEKKECLKELNSLKGYGNFETRKQLICSIKNYNEQIKELKLRFQQLVGINVNYVIL